MLRKSVFIMSVIFSFIQGVVLVLLLCLCLYQLKIKPYIITQEQTISRYRLMEKARKMNSCNRKDSFDRTFIRMDDEEIVAEENSFYHL